MFDLLIKNAAVIDGTGSPAYHSDIAVCAGKIARIARGIKEEARVVLDAKGLTVTPGFIDSHSHSDNALLEFPEMIEKIEQGITTSVGGQCGATLAPIYKGVNPETAKDVAGFGKETDVYKTFGAMAQIAKGLSLGSNLITFVGHSALRKAVLGFDDRKPTIEEMEQMKVLLRDAMENGAVGLSYGLVYAPSCHSETEELIELAKVVKEYEGLISAHIRNEGDYLAKAVEEFLCIVKAADVKGVVSHHKAMYKENWGKIHHTMRMIREAAEEGYDVYCDVYPYAATHTSLLATIVDKTLRDRDDEEVLRLLSDPEFRQINKDRYYQNNDPAMNHLQIAHCAGHPEWEGRRIGEIAKENGREPMEMAMDILKAADGHVGVCDFAMCEEDIEAVLRFERSMICTDSSVAKNAGFYHPRLRGTFPRVLGRYVRERKVTGLPEMIRKCTAMPASVYGLATKGILKVGMDADLCIFDAERIIDRADYKNCKAGCEGLNYVILGGEVVAENGVFNGKKNGRFIFAGE